MSISLAQVGLFTVYLDETTSLYFPMTHHQIAIAAILLCTVVLFLWAKWRHDLVAMSALLVSVLLGLVPTHEAFTGFAHPAVITVAAVLVLSQSLQTSGAIDALTRVLLPESMEHHWVLVILVALAAFLSAFMNNVGALALLMPIGIQLAKTNAIPIGRVLMPLAFGSILGGMTTLIGTPPNLIVAGFRESVIGSSYTMFDFSPVGIVVAICGVLFVLFAGRWLIPERTRAGIEDFDTGHYLSEAHLPESAKAVGLRIHQAEELVEHTGAQVVALVRGGQKTIAPHGNTKLRAGDTLVIEAEPKPLMKAIGLLGLELSPPAELKTADTESALPKNFEDEDLALMEVVVMPTSGIISRSAISLRLRARYGINLLAISRQGQRNVARLRSMRFRPSDVLLMEGPIDQLQSFAFNNGCVPLADRSLRIPQPGHAWIAAIIMLAAIMGAGFGLMPAAITFCLGAIVLALGGILPLEKVYSAIDWPVVVLLGALIPVAEAMSSSGLADLLAQGLVNQIPEASIWIAIVVLMVVTMSLSDFMNNAATAAVMCPIALSTATSLGIASDPLLMSVAVGASCAFLTPIGHQNNTLILSPAGFKFGDYWRLGLPLEVVVVVTATPMILLIWPP